MMPTGGPGSGRTWRGVSAGRGVRVGLGAAATVLMAGSTVAAVALNGAPEDVAPSARLSAIPPLAAPRAAPPAPSAAVPTAPVTDLGARPDRVEVRPAAVTAPQPLTRHAGAPRTTPAPVRVPAGVPTSPVVGVRAAGPRPTDVTPSERSRAHARQQLRAEMRREAREYVAAHWHMPMTP